MDIDKEITPVVFRVHRDQYREVFALFPTIDEGLGRCATYAHIGQHGAGDYGHCINITDPARPEEYAGLLAELKSIGYNVRVYKRWSRGRL